MSRIKSLLNKLMLENKKSLTTFITAGYPNPKYTVDIMNILVESGTDIIEIGIPFSDPMCDGKIIQKSYEKALKLNVNINDIFKYVCKFREFNNFTPIILMGYANPIERMGIDNFIYYAKKSDIDGVIIVDYPSDECKEFTKKLNLQNINQIFLLSPTSQKNRIKKILKISNGFVYYVSLNGVTGSKNINFKNIQKKVSLIRKYTKLPINIGFGINNLDTIKKIRNIANGIIIGSKIIQEIENSTEKNIINNIKNLVKKIYNTINK